MKTSETKSTLHLMVGLPCSGKTTYAKKLEKKARALRFTPDEWQLALFGQDAHELKHDERHSKIEEIMWELAKRALENGNSVILDFGFWAKEERDYFAAEAKKLGANTQIHYMHATIDELKKRAEKRNIEDGAMHFSPSELDKWSKWFEAPTREEIEGK